MPTSMVSTFTDPDDYAETIRSGSTQLIITEPGSFSAKYTGIDLHHAWMQRVFDNLPRISRGAIPPGRITLVFRTRPGPSFLWCGSELEPTSLVVHAPSTDYYTRSSGNAWLGSISVPVDALTSAGIALAGCDLNSSRNGQILTSAASALARFQRLHATAGRFAIDAPATIADPEAARCLEQLLIEAMIDCLSAGNRREDNAARRGHQRIMRRFNIVLEENPDRALHLPELCALIGVTERTFRRCCHEQLGIGPKRFLLLRRMHLARRALRDPDAAAPTVTSIAARFGFWDFGRFASTYKSLFGEAPSLTLRHTV
jgi:AraC-like DNA-binding protein